jgi:hypothetical protein
MLTFNGVVKPDIEPKPELATIINNIDNQVRVVASAPLIFATKSGNPITPNTVSVHSASYVGADLEVDNHLYVTPYIHTPSLPSQQRGDTVLTVCFQHDIGMLAYDIPIRWKRNDPLRIIKLASGAYAVGYTDHCKFKVSKLTVTSELAYKTHFSGDGTTLFLEQTKAKPKPLRRRRNGNSAIANATVAKNHHRPIKTQLKSIHRHQVTRIKPSPSINHNSKPKHGNNVLIQLETTHPYRSEVTMNGE